MLRGNRRLYIFYPVASGSLATLSLRAHRDGDRAAVHADLQRLLTATSSSSPSARTVA